MATIKTKLKQLRNADVRYISLVDRAATRIPFRVLKRNKESKMGIDLTKVFKSENTDKPFVSALVVFAQKDDAVTAQIREAMGKHGFKTDKVQKSDDGETLVYAQQEAKGETMVVRLSDQMLVTVGGLRTPEGWVGEMVEEHGFFPDLKLATAALHDQMALVAKSDTPQEDAQTALENYGSYLQQMFVLPSNAYALDEAIVDIIQKCSCEEKDEKKTEVQKESEEEEAARKKRVKSHPPAEMAPADEDADQEPPPPDEEEEKAKKADDSAILAALKDIGTTVAGLSTKLETVVTEQASQKKVLDEVVQKADTLGTKLGTTLTAPPVSEDRPAPARMRVQKDEDPRTGTFDTAFLRRRR
jgi:hypothetical protein